MTAISQGLDEDWTASDLNHRLRTLAVEDVKRPWTETAEGPQPSAQPMDMQNATKMPCP